VPPSAKAKNVAVESRNPASILNFYRKLTALRRTNAALREGEYVALAENEARVLAYLRRAKEATVLVALNMSAAPQTLRPGLAAHGVEAARATTLLATHRSAGAVVTADAIPLQPFEVLVAELAPAR
jgi:glycosidase